MLAIVAIQDHGNHRAAFAFGGFLENVGGTIAAAVVDQDDFDVLAQLCTRRFGTTQQLGQALLFVVDRYDDRDALDWIRFQRLLSRMVSVVQTMICVIVWQVGFVYAQIDLCQSRRPTRDKPVGEYRIHELTYGD